ncbi:PqiA/YebS family transporter subunit [Desulfoprunum benzoelyticum]|uniref:Paraquat-inducible protein A n=1 Tax=Desulfoprunum benzoelyticum TaxID=1506996 RepID=A0A840US76_9BACT|nr:PqiA/YebS family transporter subunit [Desulfoprunum benzoelyticum]MBB5348642.1 paraquat-inducible protein A [Desulfoprunum benzoelyticum]MBM9529895.1 PqiA/YebS family transporter subunit [Desulfoprunum benzoelyticum]
MPTHTVACPDCDLLLAYSASLARHTLRCPRCGCMVHRRADTSVDTALAFSITGLLLYIPAMVFPLMTLETLGMSESGSVIDTLICFYDNRYYFVAFIVLISAVVFPLLLLSLIFTVTMFARMGRYPSFLTRLLRLYVFLEEWAMIEIFLLGIMITIMKMRHSAEIHFDPGFYCFLALVLTTMAIATVLDRERLWALLSPPGAAVSVPSPPANAGSSGRTALASGLVLCHVCRQLERRRPPAAEPGRCRRCGATIHDRKPDSIAYTWALVLTSALLLIPANILPIMEVEFLGVPENSTILDGIMYFFKDGSYLIGLIILTASVFVPVFKIIGLIILLLTAQTNNTGYLRSKTVLYRFITFIGRWSMLDIFVIALLVVLVDFGFLTSIHAAPAATYFCIVVTSTMLAAKTFDARLIWDNHRQAACEAIPPLPVAKEAS